MPLGPRQQEGQTRDVGALMRRIHTLAVVVIAASIIAGGYNMDRALTRNAADAETINIAGAQRMLSQRVVALTFLLQNAAPEDKAVHHKALTNAHARMRDGHHYLTVRNGDDVPPALGTQALANHYSAAGKDLKARVDAFLDRTKSALNGTSASDMPIEAGLDLLLSDLDMAVSYYEANAIAKVRSAESVLKRTILLALIVLLLVAIFVFRPIAKQASGELEKSRQALRQRSELLSRSFQIAKMGYWVNRADRPNEMWISQEITQLYKIQREEGWLSLQDLKGMAQDQNNELLSKAARECRSTGKPQYIETRLRRADGTFIDISTSIAAEFDNKGDVEFITGVVRDITHEVEARNTIAANLERLEESASDLQEAQKLGNIAMWRLPLGSSELVLQKDSYDLLRYDFAQEAHYRALIHNPSTSSAHLRSLCIGDSFDRLVDAQRSVYQTGDSKEVNITMRRGDGTIADLAIRIKLQHGPDGQPAALFGTMQDITDQKEAQRQLEQLAYYDHLTGLSNRALCMRRLKAVCSAKAQEGSVDSALVLIDLDDFKEINDGLGHQAGDEFLCEIGKRLSQHAGPHNLVARLGGDEFAVIINNKDSRDDISRLVSDMLSSLSLPMRIGGADVMGGASAGICLLPSDTVDASEALRFADLALYDAKESGRNRLAFFDPNMSARLQSRLSLSRDLKAAIAKSELETHFQPIVSGLTGRVTGFETLMRWYHKEKGWISPSEFIPVAESSHLIGDIGAFALSDACRHAKEINAAVTDPIEVSVNMSAAQLWHGDVEQMVARALETSQLDPALLCIELTESVFVGDSIDRVDALLRRLKARGIQLALDDFGTGYSSLGYLNNLPFDKLKIDRSFVAGADVSERRYQVLEGIVSLARGLGMDVVAEGVETASELRAVRSLNCHSIQGFFFGWAEPQARALEAVNAINAQAEETLAANIAEELNDLTAVANTGMAVSAKRA